MIYELRTYHAMPGKMEALHLRFSDLVVGLLAKHGIDALGFWTDYVGPSNHTVTWLVRFTDVQQRERRWNAMTSDPEWLEGLAKSEEDGPLLSHWENRLLSPTAYSNLR